MPDSPTRHADSAGAWGEALVALMDITNDIIGGITLLALPVVVMAPGLLAMVALGIPLLLPFVALGLVLGIVSIPFIAGWWLVRTVWRIIDRGGRHSMRRRAGGQSRAEVAPKAAV